MLYDIHQLEEDDEMSNETQETSIGMQVCWVVMSMLAGMGLFKLASLLGYVSAMNVEVMR